jgi:hypothetical protein
MIVFGNPVNLVVFDSIIVGFDFENGTHPNSPKHLSSLTLGNNCAGTNERSVAVQDGDLSKRFF